VRLLLDTHALLWALLEPARLSADASALIRHPANDVLVSAATAWELATKRRLGRLPQAGAVVAAYDAHLTRLRADELPVRSQHALLAGRLPVAHRDPFDRMLAAQAIFEGVVLVTLDPAFGQFADLQTRWQRGTARYGGAATSRARHGSVD
jgi:PIN domain nuclease of toxin-antitoxin system